MILVVMAAGIGSRFGGIKQLTPVGKNGEFIIDYSIYDALIAGIEKVVFVIKEDLYKDFKETIGNRIEKKVKIEYAFQKINEVPSGITVPQERTKPWGTGQALLAAKPYIDNNFIIINADDFYGRDAITTLAAYLKKLKNDTKKHYAMVGYILENTVSKNGTVSRGICQTKNDYLTSITERTKIGYNENNELVYYKNNLEYPIDKHSKTSMNLFGFTKEVFTEAEQYFNDFFKESKNLIKDEYYLPTIVRKSIENDIADVKVLTTNSKYTGITYKEDLETLKNTINKLIKDGVYPDNLWGE